MSEERPWLKHYPKGVPANIDADAYPTLVDFLEDCFQQYPNRPAFACMGKELSYHKMDQYSERFGAYLQSRGLEPGDRIALMMPNILQYPVALFGALRAGLVVVNTNPLYTVREMRHQFKDSGVKAIVILENFCDKLEEVLPDTEIKTVIKTSVGELLGIPKRWIVNFVVRYIKRKVPSYTLTNAVSFSEALSQGKKFTLEKPAQGPDDMIFIQYTGGTTGTAKGAMLTNRNLVANMEQIKAILKPGMKENKQEIALCPLPMYHIFALTVNCLSLMGVGSLTVLVTNPRDLGSVMKEFKRYDITLMTGVNTLFNALLQHKNFKDLPTQHLNITVAGGMALQRSVAERWQKATGCPLTEGYGLTETAPLVSVNPVDGSGKIGTIGLPAPSTDVRICDQEWKEVPVGEIGELQVKGPQVMKGYYNRPDETQDVLKNGWLATGDMAFMHDDGYFEIVDRKKDMINVSGFKVYPNEVEEVFAAHQKIAEVAIVGIPDERSGEAVKAFIVKSDDSLTEQEILDYSKENLTNYKIPSEVEFRDELPKSTVGKILRKDLREEEE